MEIVSNGSKWAGQAPDELDALHRRLREHTLDPAFERYGDFVSELGAVVTVWGNFLDVSGVFRIYGTVDELAETVGLIRANQRTDAYRTARAALFPEENDQ